MKKRADQSSRDLLLQNLSELLLEAVGPQGRDNSALDPIRRAARIAGKRLALNLDSYWSQAKDVEGPIDVIDMFSGCGGMSAGFAAANGILPAFRLALAVDIAEEANESYARNLGVCPVNLDIGKLADDPAQLASVIRTSRRRPGHPLVLIGCAPCQGFSSHRNAAGQTDGRNNLFTQFAKIAAELQPDAVVVENVPELLTDRYWGYLEEAKEVLARSGYHVHVGIHNMAEFGVPQERFRALLLAMKRPFKAPSQILTRSQFRTVRDAIGKLPKIDPGKAHPKDPMHYTAGHRDSTIATIRAVPKDGGSRPYGVGPDCLQRIEVRQGKAAYEDIYGRLFWSKPSITVTAFARNPASGRFVHPEQDRGLSVREVALLQGFPKNYWFSGSMDERFRQVGNAVPPTFAAYLAFHILGEMLAKPPSESTGPGITSPIGPSFARLIPALKTGHRFIKDMVGSS